MLSHGLTRQLRQVKKGRALLMQLEGIDHVALAVRDVERSATWYVDVLGFERCYQEMWDGIPTFIGKGNTAIALFPADPNASSTPSHRSAGRAETPRHQIRIPGSRNFALNLFSRSRRPPSRDHDLRSHGTRIACSESSSESHL